MASPPPHSYPSPTQAQISDGTHPHPFYAAQQQQHAPQAVMDPQHRPREHSMPSNQGAEDYASRPVAAHPQPYNNNLGNPEYPMQQMQQVTQQSPHVDPSGTPLSKRPKTSRACDQCRGKKTRCDEVPGSEGSQCVSCRRNNQMCEFSREPQKRGPSKGYIKELAERVDVLEKTRVHNKQFVQSPSVQLPVTSPAPQAYGTAIGYPETPLRFGSSKRTHSVSEDLQNSPALQAQLQASANLPTTSGSSSSRRLTAIQADKEVEMTELYYSKVHSFLPFLPHSKDVLFNMLSQTSEIVHYAFHGALLVFCNPEKYSTIPFRGSEIETSKTEYARTLSDLQHDSKSTQTPVDKLVVLQALLLMIFAAEFNSPATAGDRGWYIQALGASAFLFGDLRRVRKRGVVLGDNLDEYHFLSRRAFLTLVTMERWNAAGVSAQTIIPEDLTKLVAADKILLGDLGYSALRASFVLGHVVDTVLLGLPQPTVEWLWTGFSAEMERVREGLELETTVMAILPKFIDLYFNQQAPSDFSDDSSPTRTMEKTYEILTMLPGRDMAFPLSHHVVAMAVMLIDEAIRKHEVGDEARHGLMMIRNLAGDNGIFIDGTRTMWATVIKKFAEDSLSRLSDGDTTDRAGLQHLADAAVGETEAGNPGSGQEAPKDPVVAPVGYLTYVVDGSAEK